MKVRKAVIPAAGLGTRFLPASKASPKEMATVVDKPSIQYVVEEAVRAGLDDVLIVTGRGKAAIEDHFDRAFELEATLRAKGKDDLLALVRQVSDLAQVHTVRQPEPLGLGHAVGMARQHVGGEPFAVLLPDDLIGEEETLLADLIGAAERHQAHVVATMRVRGEQLSAYGVAAVDPEPVEPGLYRMRDLVEKPDPDQAPSDLAVIGRYVLQPTVFDSIARTRPDARGEVQLTDALKAGLGACPVLALAFDGTRYDTGDKADYLRATVELAVARDDLGPGFRAFLTRFAAALDRGEDRG
ncbi:MAG TPA: UTP--glucose-1-phosphate uridylyltransferase [Actinomycetes bacterium]|nr:UTP--glucose-1-phosphate uridylyltransferase [Actinomycetes bacterium]